MLIEEEVSSALVVGTLSVKGKLDFLGPMISLATTQLC